MSQEFSYREYVTDDGFLREYNAYLAELAKKDKEHPTP